MTTDNLSCCEAVIHVPVAKGEKFEYFKDLCSSEDFLVSCKDDVASNGKAVSVILCISVHPYQNTLKERVFNLLGKLRLAGFEIIEWNIDMAPFKNKPGSSGSENYERMDKASGD